MSKEWRPDYPVTYAPLFKIPPNVIHISKWLFGYPGYIWPWNVIYVALTFFTLHYTNPPISQCKEYSLDWILTIFLRNQILIWMFAGGWHSILYIFKLQGSEKKYDPKWQATNNPKFLFNDQVYDNIFWSCVSGVPFWTAYEAYMLHNWANNPESSVLLTNWNDNLVYNTVWLFLIPIWREFHFYWIHRFIHIKPIYKAVHYLHHKNSNPGPWSGLAMHPVEHLLYFSVVLIHLIVPSHPFHFFFNSQHTALTPAGGHHGFEGPILDDKLPTGSYFHYLHHRYFECNYGEATIPLDKLFGTFRDGQKEGVKLQGKEH